MSDRDLARVLWDYNQLHHNLKPADFIFVMCSYNLDVADRAYDLFQQNMGKFIAVSGGIAHQGDLVETPWEEAEGVVFKKRLLELGLPEDKIIVEDQATNCGENVQLTKPLVPSHLQTGIVVQKPYMERRAYATACQQWPELSWQVTSPTMSYEGYIEKFDEDRLIHILVGDTSRVKDYAEKGFQIPQDMPQEVENSLKELINKGYTKHISV